MFIVEPIAGSGHSRTNRSVSFNQSDAHPIEILQQPVVIERHRTDDVGLSTKSDDTNSVVWSSGNEFARDFSYRVEASRLFAADGEVFRQHGARNIEHEHDVDSARFHLGEAFSELRPGDGNNESGEREPNQSAKESPSPTGAAFSDRTERRSCRKDDCCLWSNFPAQ